MLPQHSQNAAPEQRQLACSRLTLKSISPDLSSSTCKHSSFWCTVHCPATQPLAQRPRPYLADEDEQLLVAGVVPQGLHDRSQLLRVDGPLSADSKHLVHSVHAEQVKSVSVATLIGHALSVSLPG